MNTAKTRPPVTTEADIGLDARLTLASAGIDAVMVHRHQAALYAAQLAVQAAESWMPVPPQDPPNEVLERARRVIETRGWVQHEYTAVNGAVCAQRAVCVAAPYGPGRDAALSVLQRRILEETHEDMSVTRWNDTRSNVSDVLRLLY